ncbi:MAG: hypothetical protein ACT6T2_18070 [Shinella sp.]|uniref:hypothetical protein n=1 Tax=Shinella sp. TaxID=1870904 RepID=UPI004036FD4F
MVEKVEFAGAGTFSNGVKSAAVRYELQFVGDDRSYEISGTISGLSAADHNWFINNNHGTTLTLENGKTVNVAFFGGGLDEPLLVQVNDPLSAMV